MKLIISMPLIVISYRNKVLIITATRIFENVRKTQAIHKIHNFSLIKQKERTDNIYSVLENQGFSQIGLS